jgi:hypothetical protein
MISERAIPFVVAFANENRKTPLETFNATRTITACNGVTTEGVVHQLTTSLKISKMMRMSMMGHTRLEVGAAGYGGILALNQILGVLLWVILSMM